MQKIFNFYADPGHGWMAVKKQQLVELGIAAKISSYSYHRGDTAYLEEDGDLDQFFKAFTEKNGVKPILKQHHGDRQSKIRNYEAYRCDSAEDVIKPISPSRYSIAQKSGGSHEDDEVPLFSLAILSDDETSEAICREVSYTAAYESAHDHAKQSGCKTYQINGNNFTA